jgi:hypothetical protein
MDLFFNPLKNKTDKIELKLFTTSKLITTCDQWVMLQETLQAFKKVDVHITTKTK